MRDKLEIILKILLNMNKDKLKITIKILLVFVVADLCLLLLLNF